MATKVVVKLDQLLLTYLYINMFYLFIYRNMIYLYSYIYIYAINKINVRIITIRGPYRVLNTCVERCVTVKKIKTTV